MNALLGENLAHFSNQTIAESTTCARVTGKYLLQEEAGIAPSGHPRAQDVSRPGPSQREKKKQRFPVTRDWNSNSLLERVNSTSYIRSSPQGSPVKGCQGIRQVVYFFSPALVCK